MEEDRGSGEIRMTDRDAKNPETEWCICSCAIAEARSGRLTHVMRYEQAAVA